MEKEAAMGMLENLGKLRKLLVDYEQGHTSSSPIEIGLHGGC